jgi:hypothetical protein
MQTANIEIIKKVSKIIADKIQNENIQGSCNFTPFILKYYLKRFHNIEIDIFQGLLEYNEKYAPHIWNEYNNKLIDISVHKQLIEEVNSNCIILDEIYIKNNALIKYHKSINLPKRYLDEIKDISYYVDKQNNKVNLSTAEQQELNHISKLLNSDTKMRRMDKMNINEIKITKSYIKNHFKKEMNDYFKYIKDNLKS